jgi:patatin-related protein
MTMPTATETSHAQLQDYSSEIRFGVVMYGGVSLAIYMNGVANEMVEMACSTPLAAPVPGKMHGTRELYYRLSWLVDNPSLRRQYATRIEEHRKHAAEGHQKDAWIESLALGGNLHPVRFVIDVISGTSAGGINGIFLAKVLATGDPFAPLQKLWVQEGDIGLLLNDKDSYQGLPRKYDRSVPPTALLNGERMYLKLCDALEQMDAAPSGGTASPLVDEMDLFVTTTDILGAPVPLRLSRQLVYERRYKQNFHFSYRTGAETNPFERQHNGLLAFAARCTSSFPFAFEPMTLDKVCELRPELQNEVETTWPQYFAYLPADEVAAKKHLRRAFGDGGYLDNKPFSYVAQTLAIRQSDIPVERKLIYVEPVPEQLNPREFPPDEVPDALTNSLAALTGIPRYETIREDLQEVLRRNRSIERVDRIVREGEHDLHLALYEGDRSVVNPFVRIIKDSNGKVPPWPQFTRSRMVKYYGTAILAYRRLRVSVTTDSLGRQIAELWKLNAESDYLYALTALIRVWRDNQYGEEEIGREAPAKTINQFLDEFDVEYRIRRLGFLLRQIDHLRRFLRAYRDGLIRPDTFAHFPDSERLAIRRLERAGWRMLGDQPDRHSLNAGLEALHVLKMELNEAQRKWRTVQATRGRDAVAKLLADKDLRKEMEDVLAMLLGECKESSLVLRRSSGQSTGVRLPDLSRTAAARASTMQESVVERAKGLFQVASETDRTMIHDALETILAALRLPRIEPSSFTILGAPTLRLVPERTDDAGERNPDQPDAERIEVSVNTVGNPALDSREGMALRRLLGESYVYFDLFDQMSLPLYHDANIGEPATVEVTRISPPDAVNLIDEARDTRRKLAGTALGHFGAFIDRNWRLNDIMWGRLDGAERLIQTLLPMQDPATETVRTELIRLAQCRILRETLVPGGARELTDLMCKAVQEIQARGEAKDQVDALLKRVLPGGTAEDKQKHLAHLLASLLSEEELIGYVRDTRDVERGTDPRQAVTNASRAVTILGRMLEGISVQRNKSSMLFRWLARGGLILQGLVAVSLPGSFKALWRAHFMNILLFIALATGALALLTGDATILGFAVKAIIVLVVVYLVVFILTDIMQSRRGWQRKGMWSGAVLIALLAVLGGLSVYHELQSLASGNGSLRTMLTATR